MYKIFACLCCVFVGIADASAAQQAAFKADGSFPLNFWPNRAFLNNDIKAALDTVKLNVARGGRVAVFVGCAEESEKDARFLAEVRPVYAKSWLTDEGGNSDTAGGSILLRSCNHLGSGPSLVYLFQEGHVPSNEEMDSHDVSVTLPTHTASRQPDVILSSTTDAALKNHVGLERIILDAQTHGNEAYLLSGSCGVKEIGCSEGDYVPHRLDAVRRRLVQAGIDSRRITQQSYDDGTPTVKLFVIHDASRDVRVAATRDIAEAPPSNFLNQIMPSLKATLPASEYDRAKAAFQSCKAVAVLFYPPSLGLGWSEEKGTVRLLTGELQDPQFQERLQALDVRKYLPSACMYDDVSAGAFPQPPPGILVKRLAQNSPIQNVNPSSFSIDSQLGDSLAPGLHFTDHRWTITPQDDDSHSFGIMLRDGTELTAPVRVEQHWTFYTKKLWVVIVALAGVGFFGAVTGLFKKKPPEKV